MAFVVAAPGVAPSSDGLSDYCRAHLAPYKVPVRFEMVDALPRNEVGKVLKAELKGSQRVRLRETPEEQAFRPELRAWLDEALPTLPPEPPFEDWTAKRRLRHAAGSAASTTPATPASRGREEYGGRGATPSEELIFLEETEKAGAPYVGCNFVSTAARRPDASRPRARPSSGPGTCRRSCGATTCGARASPSPRPAPTSPRCAPGPSATATTTSSAGRRSGRRTPRSPTTASCWCAPTPTRPSTGASPG